MDLYGAEASINASVPSQRDEMRSACLLYTSHLVDLDAAFGTGNNRDQLREIVHELGDRVNIELSGGVRDDASLDAALEAGAARVNIGTAALENPDWTASVIKKYGDRVAVGLDVRGHTLAARGWTREGGDLFETMKFLDSVGCSRYVVTRCV